MHADNPSVTAEETTETTDAAEQPEAQEPDGELAGQTVMIVDDDPDVIQTLEAAFEPTGCRLLTTKNGNKAIEYAEKEQIDLIVLDMMLPGRSGFLVLEALKADRLPSEKPYVIMLTGNDGVRHQQYAEARGVNDYFHKPASLQKLLDRSIELLKTGQ
jgi:DNA-binding response OmpR family regulator